VKSDAVFATNTSGLAIADLSKAVSEARRAKFIGMHWFSSGAGDEARGDRARARHGGGDGGGA
jgi:hypothetical protein